MILLTRASVAPECAFLVYFIWLKKCTWKGWRDALGAWNGYALGKHGRKQALNKQGHTGKARGVGNAHRDFTFRGQGQGGDALVCAEAIKGTEMAQLLSASQVLPSHLSQGLNNNNPVSLEPCRWLSNSRQGAFSGWLSSFLEVLGAWAWGCGDSRWRQRWPWG